MDGSDFDRMRRQSEQAKNEMFDMRSRAMPPMPPFVKTPNHSADGVNRGGGNRSAPTPPPSTFGEVRQNENRHDTAPEREAEHKKRGLLSGDLFKMLNLQNFELDSDRMLLLLLAALLSGENQDEILIFALAYIML